MKVLLLGIVLIPLCYSAEPQVVDQASEEQQAQQYTAIHRVHERAPRINSSRDDMSGFTLTEHLVPKRERNPLLTSRINVNADDNFTSRFFTSLSEVTLGIGSIPSSQLLLSTSHVTAVAGAPPPPPRDDFFRGISLEQPFLHFLRFDGNYLSENLSNFLEYLYRPRFFEFSVFLNTHYYDNLIRSLLDSAPAPAPVHDVASQEALTAGRERVRDDYVTMATKAPSATAIARHLPSPDAVDAAFGECFSNLNDLYDILLVQKTSDAIKFRFENAKRTLALIGGDASIEHHPISSVDRYSTYSYDGLPNVRQLLVLAWRLSKVDLRDFVESSIAVHCDTPAKWQAWRRPFTSNPRFNDVLSYADFGQSIMVPANWTRNRC